MKFEKYLTISNKADLSFEAHLFATSDGNFAKLDLNSDHFNMLTIEGVDFWDCLLKLRRFLEQKELFILCQGSAENVHPSGMARDMSNGLIAYSFELGKKVTRENIVEVFDPAPVERV